MKVLLLANTAWYLYNFRRSLAVALRDAGHDVLLSSPPGAYVEELQSLGFRWVASPIDRASLNPLRELIAVARLRRLLLREQVELVHGFTIKCAVYGAMAGRLAGLKAWVSAFTGMGYLFTRNDLRARILRPMVRTLMRLTIGGPGAAVILQNRDDVSLFRRAGLVDMQKVHLIAGSGVDCERFHPALRLQRRTESAAGPLRVLMPSRLLWDKGLAEYVQAAQASRSQGRNIEFLLAGNTDPGNPMSVPDETLRQWVDEGTVQWLGHIDDMPALFATVDVVALPSYREGLPKCLIEAAGCGLPLVTTDAPGCRDVVTDQVDGLLVPVSDATALADAIARLHDDPALRLRLGAAARERAVMQFDERLVIHKTMAVYKLLLFKDMRGGPSSSRTVHQIRWPAEARRMRESRREGARSRAQETSQENKKRA